MGESEKENNFERLLNRDAVLLAVLAGLSYYFVYSFQKSFLGYFGFSAIFVEITLDKIWFSVGVVVGFMILVYSLTAIFPVKLFRPLLLNYLYWSLTILLGFLTGLFFIFSGYIWITFLWAAVFLIRLFFDLSEIIGGIRSGKSYSEILDADNDYELGVSKTLLGPSMVHNLLDSIGALPFFVIIFTLAGGGIIWCQCCGRKKRLFDFAD